MLTHDEQQVLHALILPQLGGNPSTDVAAGFVGEDIAQNMPAVNRVSQLAWWIIDRALSQDTPDVLIKVLYRIDNLDARAASIHSLIARLSDDPSVWRRRDSEDIVDWTLNGDPLYVDDDRSPFVDREFFRQLLPRKGAVGSPKCILVQGKNGSGKTYLSRFCRRLDLDRKEFRTGITELGSSGVQSIGPEIPALSLAVGLQTDSTKEPRAHEDPHRYARNLAAWITEFTPARDVPALAIFDGYDDPDVQESVHTFIREVLRRIQTDSRASERLRVVLLGYDSARLQRAGLDYQSCVLEYVDASHIDTWFRQRFPSKPQYQYEDTIEIILQRVPPSGSLRMQNLCFRIQLASRGFQED